MTAPLDISRLSFADLPQVVAIERRAFTAPWSLSMFVLELSKADGVCLAARPRRKPDGSSDRTDIVGYLICSRYDTVWHVMNVAVDPDCRRRGVGKTLLRQLLAIVGETTRLTLEVRISNDAAIALYEELGFRAPACAAATTRTTARTR